MIEKILSGGQTGVDRAALDVALKLSLPCGGWCPKGRQAEDGPLPPRYPLEETPSADYAQRTEWNVRDADGTLVLARGTPTGVTALTVELAGRLRKPYLVVDLDAVYSAQAVHAWVNTHQLRVLNIAGPRESSQPGIYEQVAPFLHRTLSAYQVHTP